MRIEAVVPLTVKRLGGDVQLVPGTPVEFSDDDARRLLEKAPGKVRAVVDWLALWRHLAAITYGIEVGDPRLPAILEDLGPVRQGLSCR